MRETTVDRANGKWHGILTELGAPPAALTGRHCPCPFCGGEDRFRFTNHEGDGTFICNQCGRGGGVEFVKRLLGIEFKEAVQVIDKIVGSVDADRPRRRMDKRSIRMAMNELWGGAGRVREGDAVDAYLRGRGLALPNNREALRLHDRARAPDGTYHPAMLAMVTGADGKPATIHRTYLGKNGKADIETPRALMPGTLPDGSAIRLYRHRERLGIGTGIETSIAAARKFKVPTWAAINDSMLVKWIPPSGVKEVWIFGDNDIKMGGQAAAYALGHKLMTRFDVSCRVMIPDEAGKDWADG